MIERDLFICIPFTIRNDFGLINYYGAKIDKCPNVTYYSNDTIVQISIQQSKHP